MVEKTEKLIFTQTLTKESLAAKKVLEKNNISFSIILKDCYFTSPSLFVPNDPHVYRGYIKIFQFICSTKK